MDEFPRIELEAGLSTEEKEQLVNKIKGDPEIKDLIEEAELRPTMGVGGLILIKVGIEIIKAIRKGAIDELVKVIKKIFQKAKEIPAGASTTRITITKGPLVVEITSDSEKHISDQVTKILKVLSA